MTMHVRSTLFGLAALALTVGVAPPALANEILEEIIRGRAIAPVPLKVPENVNRLSAYLGSYVVEAMATCNSCHSNKEYTATGNPFNGQRKQVNKTCYLNGGQSFGPGLVSANITPDKTGRPAGLTYAAFKDLMRTGHDPRDPGTLLQVMPWDGFQNMTETDLRAIYDYLSSIPTLPDGGSAPC